MTADQAGKSTRRAVIAGLVALPLGGCVTGSSDITGSIAGATSKSRPSAAPGTISFEPIIGPPASVVGLLADQLAVEAVAKKVAVVPAATGGAYRVKGYMAAARAGDTVEITYIWDIVDAGGSRIKRISGTEQAPSAGDDPWAVLSAERLHTIAAATIDGLIAATGPLA